MFLAGASPIEEVSLKQYCKSLQRVAVLRLLQQLSHVYSVMKIPALADLVPFMSFGEVEQIIVDAVKHDFLQASLVTLRCIFPDTVTVLLELAVLQRLSGTEAVLQWSLQSTATLSMCRHVSV